VGGNRVILVVEVVLAVVWATGLGLLVGSFAGLAAAVGAFALALATIGFVFVVAYERGG
jgi:F0F1-type ATP synthase assembly protein I